MRRNPNSAGLTAEVSSQEVAAVFRGEKGLGSDVLVHDRPVHDLARTALRARLWHFLVVRPVPAILLLVFYLLFHAVSRERLFIIKPSRGRAGGTTVPGGTRITTRTTMNPLLNPAPAMIYRSPPSSIREFFAKRNANRRPMLGIGTYLEPTRVDELSLGTLHNASSKGLEMRGWRRYLPVQIFAGPSSFVETRAKVLRVFRELGGEKGRGFGYPDFRVSVVGRWSDGGEAGDGGVASGDSGSGDSGDPCAHIVDDSWWERMMVAGKNPAEMVVPDRASASERAPGVSERLSSRGPPPISLK